MKETLKRIEYGKPKQIYFYYSNKGEVIRMPTGVLSANKEKRENRDLLNHRESVLKNILYEYRTNNGFYPPIGYLKEKLKISKNPITLIEILDSFYEYKKNIIKESSLRDISYFKNILLNFNDEHPINLNDVNENLLITYKNYLLKKDNKDNHTRKLLSSLKHFLHYCLEKKFIKNYSISENDWKISRRSNLVFQKKDFESLTDNEISFLKEKRKSDLRYRKVLDMFLFQIFTSLRFSDVIRINKNYIFSDKLKFINQKTRTPIEIDLSKTLKEILIESNYNIYHYKLSNYNRLLKQMLKKYSKEMPSFNEERSVIKYINGGKEVIETKKRYELFSSHSGRRTFVTNNFENGVPLTTIKKYTGHTRIETTIGYITNDHNSNSNISSLMDERTSKKV